MTKLVFIANSKQKKIKKLLFLSKDLIREYGVRYAFQIFLEELSKQKTNIFLPDKAPQLDFEQFASDYETFKQKHVVTPNKLELIKNELSEFPIKPSFTFLLVNLENKSDFKQSLSSILNQIYENFDLTIVNYSKDTINLDNFEKNYEIAAYRTLTTVCEIFPDKKQFLIESLLQFNYTKMIDWALEYGLEYTKTKDFLKPFEGWLNEHQKTVLVD